MYWVVTIPLTFITLGVWTLYTKVINPAAPKSNDSRSRDEVHVEGRDPKDLERKV